MEQYGYIRVSSVDQNEARQRADMDRLGIAARNIFMDKVSGRDFERPAYRRLRRRIRRDDLLVVKSIDRFGRSYADIRDEWTYLTKTVGADILVLDMPLLDTRRGKDLVGTLISDLVLQIFAYVAEAERMNIRERQREGISIARERGRHLGRPDGGYPGRFAEVCGLYASGALDRRGAARELGIGTGRFDYLRRKAREAGAPPHGTAERMPGHDGADGGRAGGGNGAASRHVGALN